MTVPNGGHSVRIEKYIIYGDPRNASNVASAWYNASIPHSSRIFRFLDGQKWNMFPIILRVDMVWIKRKTEFRLNLIDAVRLHLNVKDIVRQIWKRCLRRRTSNNSSTLSPGHHKRVGRIFHMGQVCTEYVI